MSGSTASIDRERSRDRSAVVRHSHSFERVPHVPMWDSSDPERAPPPLPLNPHPSSPTPVTRANISIGIAAAAQALADKARESAGPAPYTTNAMPERSPERSLIKGAAHKRLQSLQPGSVRDIRSFLDGNRTPDRSPERQSRSTTPACRDNEKNLETSPDKSPSRSVRTTPTPRDSLKESSSMRRSTPKPILGENTPPSATMLALQTMTVRDFHDTPLGNITNGSSNTHLPQTFEAISGQILSLTTIATNLQREMAQLSRRSKDNATDLISLKEATVSRDEDIRKSLRQLLSTTSKPINNNSNSNGSGNGNGGGNGIGNGVGNGNATVTASTTFTGVPRAGGTFMSSPTPSSAGVKAFSLPRIPSPGSLFDDEAFAERGGSPNPFSVEGAASVAMLEKIIREMVTKEGQERLVNTLNQLFENSSKKSDHTAKKVAELVEFIKESSGSRELICGNEQPRAASATFQNSSGPLTLSSREVQSASPRPTNEGDRAYNSPKAADFVSDEVIQLLKKIKDGVFQTGGVTNEVKAQQRDLRGEVLHMGRDLARKIDEARKPAGNAKAIEDGSGKQDIARIVSEGLADLKSHLDEVMRERRRNSSSSIVSRSTVDNREVYDVVKHALTERGLGQVHHGAHAPPSPPLDKDAILEAVKEAYEAYRPEIELQQFGLERDEILQCLKEGLEGYRSSAADSNAISRAEILETIHEAMQNFTPPRPINEAHEVRDEMLSAVRECLDEFRPFTGQRAVTSDRDLDVTREVVYDAVKAGLASHGPNASREIEINGDDLFHAVKAALDASGNPLGRYGQEVTLRLQDLVGELREQFKSYSAANGRDTEQVLDAMKDGLESLRGEIEQYVDRSQDVTGKDEIIDTVRGGLDALRVDVEEFCAAGPSGNRAFNRTEMLDYMKSEFENLQDAIEQISASSGHHATLLDALHSGFEAIKSNVNTRNINGSSGSEVSGSMRDELEQLREVILTRSGGHKDEVIDTVQAGFDTLHSKLVNGSLSSATSDDVLKVMTDEFEHLRSTVANTMVRSVDFDGKDEIIDSVQSSLYDLKKQLLGDDTSMPLLSAIRVEFDRLKKTLGGNSLIQAADSSEKEEILESLRSTLDAIREASGGSTLSSVDTEMLEAIRGEFEVLRASVASGLSRTSSKADFEEIHDAIRLGLDDLRSHLEKKIDNPDRQMSAHSEFLDAINDGLDSLKTDITKTINKPIDMTVSYEILDTLKDGIASLRADFEHLKEHKGRTEPQDRSLTTTGHEIMLVEDSEEARKEVTKDAPITHVKASDLLHRNDVEKMEVMLAQLQVKVEAMDANIHDFPQPPSQPATGTAMKTDLSTIEELLKDMRASMDIVASREIEAEKLAKKEDVDAIETLLRNTKSRLEEIQLPDHTTDISREQMDAVENLVKSTREAIDDLGVEIKDNVASKQDVTLIEVLVQDLKTALDEIKDGKKTADKEGDDSTKTDLDVLKLLTLEIKEKVLEMQSSETDGLPTKADVELLTGLIQEFRDSHDKLRDRYEDDIGVTAKAFDDRKKEAVDIITSIGLVKSFLGDIKDELKAKVESTGLDVSLLSDNVRGLEETIAANFSISGDVKELMETVTREFERVSGLVENVKQEQDQKTTSAEEKHEEVRAAVIAAICSKVDDRFDALISKYDEAQLDAIAQIKAMDEKSSEQEHILASTRNVAEELKLSVDTLGSTVTGMECSFKELATQITNDSNTVFSKVDEGFGKLKGVETRTAAKEEHQQTRDHVSRAISALDTLQSDVTEYHPKFMVTLQEIQALISQHFEHSQKAQQAAQKRDLETSEVSRSLTEEIKSSFSSLPALLPAPVQTLEHIEKYDDTPVHAKLDQLITSLDSSKDAFGQLDRLDKIHQQVMATATEVSSMVSTQTRLITEGHDSKEKEAEEVALLLERRRAEKEHVEKDVYRLNDEKDSLLAIISELRAERDNLVSHKVKLATDVSALETALHIRKEELHDMDRKADALERRVLEGIMDQSRALLLSKGVKSAALGNGGNRSLSGASHSTLGALPPSAASAGLSLAIKNRSSPARRSVVPQGLSPASRRIMSLNQISHNTPTGAQGYKAANTGLGAGLKRSQSVRTQSQALRKVSWNGNTEKRRAVSAAIEEDKENSTLGEIHDEEEPHNDDIDDGASTGTVTITDVDSRVSYATSTNGGYADSVMTSDRSDYTDDRRTSGDSEHTYSTGSYLSGTDLSRRSSEVGTLHEESEGEESGSEYDDAHTEANTEAGATDLERLMAAEEEDGEHTPVPADKKIVLYSGPLDSDSGLGSEVPTAGALSGSETDYFRRRAEEVASSVGG